MLKFFKYILYFLGGGLFYSCHSSGDFLEASEAMKRRSVLFNNYKSSIYVFNNAHLPEKYERLQKAFNKLALTQLPVLPITHLYVAEERGTPINIVECNFLSSSFSLKLLAPFKEDEVDYIAKGENSHETFAYTQKKSHKRVDSSVMRRKRYGSIYVGGKKIKLQISHGIDDADKVDGSNDEFNNYTPANWFYNKNIRNPLVTNIIRGRGKKYKGGQYKEIAIYSSNPLMTAEKPPTPIPEGFIFISYYGNRNINKTYYFPNFIDYENLDIPKVKSQYKKYLDFFEINNITPFLRPVIHYFTEMSSQVELNIYNHLIIGINLYPFSSLNESLGLLRNLGINFSWNGARGLRKEEIKSRESILLRRSSESPFKWGGYRLQRRDEKEKIEWIDVDDSTIPKVSTDNDKIKPTQKTLALYLSTQALEEAVKSPFSPIIMKLIPAILNTKQKKGEKAYEWFSLAYHQCREKGSLEESLKIFEHYLNYLLLEQTPPSLQEQTDQLKNLVSLIENKIVAGSIEELFMVSRFIKENETALAIPTEMRSKIQKIRANIPKIQNSLKRINKIGPANSRMIRSLFFSEKEVDNLIKIIGEVDSLEEVSLENLIFYEPNQEERGFFRCIFTENEEDTYEEDISAGSFYWEYNKPLHNIFEALYIKHTSSLQKLNLRNIRFPSVEREKEIIYDFELEKVLQTLSKFKLPSLKEIYITGMASSSESLMTALKNLWTSFPNLRKIYLFLNSSCTGHCLEIENLEKLTV